MKVVLKNVRLGFHDLFKAKSIAGGAVKFSANFIIGPESKVAYDTDAGEKKVMPLVVNGEDSIMHKIIDKVAKEKFGAKKKMKIWCLNKADGSTTRDPYTNQDGEYYAGFDADTWFISAAKREDKAPGGKMVVLDQGREPVGSNKVYSGCYVNAVIDVYAMEQKEGNCVCASLEGVQLLRKGENLGGAPIDAASEFDDEEYEEGDEIAVTADGELDPGF